MMFVEYTRRLSASVAAALFCAVPCAAASHSPTSNLSATAEGFLPQGNAQDPQEIDRQRRQFLVTQYLEDAQKLREIGKPEEAKALLLKARETLPQDPRVNVALNSLLAEMGERPGTVQTFAEQMERLYQIREQRARMDVQSSLDAARRASEEKNFERAIQDLRSAVMTIEVTRDVNWGDLEKATRDRLVEAERNRDAQLRAQSEEAERETLRRLRAVEDADLARRRSQVDGYMATAITAFERRQFKISQDLARSAMQLDPTNMEARALHNAATKALSENSRDDYLVQKGREFRRWLEASEDLKTPQTDILRIDPMIAERADARRGAALPTTVETAEDADIRRQLKEKMVPPRRFTEENGSYEEVKNLLQTQTDIPIVITPEAKEAISGESLMLELDMVAPLSVENFLNQMVSRSANLAWIVREGVVQITSKAQSGGSNVLISHDIRDLIFPLTTFLPPTIRDLPGGTEGPTPRIGGEGDEQTSYIDPAALIATIKEATGAASWEGDGAGAMDSVDGGYLLVTASPSMQRQVARFLEDQRRFATSVVTVESKFLSVGQNFLQEVGVDFRGLGGSGNKGSVATLDDVTNRLQNNASRGLDNAGTGEEAGRPTAGAFFNDGGDGDVRARSENFIENGSLARNLTSIGGATASFTLLDDLQLQVLLQAVEKRQDIQVVNSQTLTVLNNQRANVAIINQTSFVRDFEVEVAQASFIADPQIDVIQDGIVLDVTPVISYDRKHVRLSLEPTVAELVRPIPTFTTSLAGSTLPVTIQLPVLTVKSFATTTEVPDGGSVLIGGLREVLTRERRAEVPVLGKLPLVSFLFKQEGVADENASLMVLVRATITDLKESAIARR